MKNLMEAEVGRVAVACLLGLTILSNGLIFGQTTGEKKQALPIRESHILESETEDLSFEVALFQTPEDKDKAEKAEKSVTTAFLPEPLKSSEKDEIKGEIISERNKNLDSSPTLTPTLPLTPVTDFVVNFDGGNNLATEESQKFEEDFSLSVDGEFVPGVKLFTELMSEAANRRFAEEASRKERQLAKAVQGNSGGASEMTAASGSAIVYVRKTTIVRTTRTSGGGVNYSMADLPNVNASVQATADAYRLVRLAAMGDGVPLPVEWAQAMVDAGKSQNVDPVLLLEVCRQESRFKNSARSGANAHGLMQFIPATAARFGVDPYNPRQAIFGGAKYLRFLLDTFRGELRSALAGYNAGEGAVIAFATGRTLYPRGGRVINPNGSRTPYGVPPYTETQNYVATIYSKYVTSLNRLRGL